MEYGKDFPDQVGIRKIWILIGVWFFCSIILPLFVIYLITGQVSLLPPQNLPEKSSSQGITMSTTAGHAWKVEPDTPINSEPAKWPFVMLYTLPFALSPILINSIRRQRSTVRAKVKIPIIKPSIATATGLILGSLPLWMLTLTLTLNIHTPGLVAYGSFVVATPAVIFGHIALRANRRTGGTLKEKIPSLTVLAMGYFAAFISVVISYPIYLEAKKRKGIEIAEYIGGWKNQLT